MVSTQVLVAQRRATTPPGILKKVEEAAEQHREERALQATSSASPQPRSAATEGAEIIDTFSTRPERTDEQAPVGVEVDRQLGTWLNDTFILHDLNGQKLLRVNFTAELVMILGGFIAGLIVLGLLRIFTKKLRRRRRHKIRRIDL